MDFRAINTNDLSLKPPLCSRSELRWTHNPSDLRPENVWYGIPLATVPSSVLIPAGQETPRVLREQLNRPHISFIVTL